MQHRALSTIRLALAGMFITTFAFAACSDDTLTSPDEQVFASARSDANIVALLHQSNLGEIAEGNVASSRATDAGVKSFAQAMVSEHTQLDAQGNTLASQQGVTPALPDSTLPRIQAQSMARLDAAATGTTFDRVYVNEQVLDHVRTLALVDSSIVRAQNAALKSALQTTIRPKIAAHLEMAQSLQARIGTP